MPENADDEVAPVDDEGLRLHYDVILVGTGLVSSILASALSRVGKTVLHTDGADYYGELDAVWTLPYLQSQEKLGVDSWLFHRKEDESPEEVPEDSSSHKKRILLSPYGSVHDLKIHSMGSVTAKSRNLSAGTEVMVPSWGRCRILGWTDESHGRDTTALLPEQPANAETGSRLVLEKSQWKLANGDCPRLYMMDVDKITTLAEQAAANILGAKSRSFAIDVTPGMIWAQGPAVLGLLQSSVSEYVEFKSLLQLWWYDSNNQTSALQAVPCSKNDVFTSSLLSPMEKRRLMKFLQLALDYSVAESEAEHAESALEVAEGAPLPAAWETLNERHLNQGRSLARPQNKTVSASGLETLVACIKEEMDYEEYLMTHPKLSEKLTTLVRCALSLDFGGENLTVGQGMQRLGQHLQSLGRFGATAFLVPMYGSGELSQAFCRSAAVYGATYLLRRAAVGIELDEDGSAEGVLLKPYTDEDSEQEPSKQESTKLVRCTHVVAPEHAVLVETPPAKLQVLRRVSILCGRPTGDSARHALLLPPKSLANAKHPYTIHGLLLDESVNVTPCAPEYGGCCILHLTTVAGTGDGSSLAVLEEASEVLTKEWNVTEIYQLSFSYPLHQNAAPNSQRKGVHILQRPQPNLTVDEAFDQAKNIFSDICPGTGFLTLSEAIDNMVKERFGDRMEEDDEQMALSSAMHLIQSNTSTPAVQPLFIWLGAVEEDARATRLLLPVPRPVEPTPSFENIDSIVERIEGHCSNPGHDPRIYFAASGGTSKDTLDFSEIIGPVIARLRGTGMQFQAFTAGTTDLSFSDIGLDVLQVSLFAANPTSYAEASGREEEIFQKACDFVSGASKRGTAVEVGLLAEYADDGLVFARSLGAKEVHVFSA
jgi:RAB protein geranylgeranyltransferase component A